MSLALSTSAAGFFHVNEARSFLLPHVVRSLQHVFLHVCYAEAIVNFYISLKPCTWEVRKWDLSWYTCHYRSCEGSDSEIASSKMPAKSVTAFWNFIMLPELLVAMCFIFLFEVESKKEHSYFTHRLNIFRQLNVATVIVTCIK